MTSSKGDRGIKTLLQRIETADQAIPEAPLSIVTCLAEQWRRLDGEIDRLDARIKAEARRDPAARRLMTIPGVGPITAHAAIAAIGDGSAFDCGRDFAAWAGLTRRNHDTGGKHKLTGRISRAGDKGLRRLLVLGAASWLRQVRSKPRPGTEWVRGVLTRRPVRVAVVAQAAKTARIIWAVLTSGESYRAPVAA